MLHHALSTWSSPPKHVVLAGSYAISDTTSYIVPTWFVHDPPVGFWTNSVPTDDPYVFTPNSADSLPRASIGRVPVWNLTDLTAFVDKVLLYETQPVSAWKTTALHVVEDRDYDGNNGFLARDHADSLAQYFSIRESYNFSRSTLYATQVNHTAVNGTIIPPWNAGLGYVFFYGTTGSDISFAFFLRNQPCQSPVISSGQTYGDSLATNNKPPLLFAMTCGNGFTRMLAGQPSTCGTLAQYLVSTPGKGAIAVIGPARALHEKPGYAISREWCQAVFASSQPSPYSEPGAAMKLVKEHLMPSMPNYRTEVMQMAVLGDPALQFYVGGQPVIGISDESDPPRVFNVRARSAPSRDLAFTVDVPRSATIEFRLFDILGRRVSSSTLRFEGSERGRELRFDAGSLKPGVYFLLGEGDGLVASTKVVLIR